MTVAGPATPSTPPLADRPPFGPFRDRAQAELSATLGDHLDRLSWNAPRLRTFQTERMRALLAHATAHSTFHAKRLAGIDTDRFELTDLAHLPVMEKATMMDHFDEVVTDRRLRRSELEALIEATGDEPIPALGDYLVLTSGGSSGTRGIFVLDAPALAEFVAATMRSAVARGAVPGDAGAGNVTMAMIAAGSPIHATGFTPHLGRGGPVAIVPVPATLPFDDIVARIRRLEPDLLYGYPSVIARLAREQLDGRLELHPVGVTTTSENLRPETRAQIEAAFGVPVVDTFGSSEGLIGVSAPGEEALTFASDGCIIELVDDHDQPVEARRLSSSVLVTNLYNLIQPLIRYRIEDQFLQQPAAEEHGHLRAFVEGRASDTLRWGDLALHPLTVVNELLHTPAIVDYMVRQTTSGVEIDVVTAAEVQPDVLADRIAGDLATAGLRAAEVTVRVIDDIERDPHTGKVARIVPLHHA